MFARYTGARITTRKKEFQHERKKALNDEAADAVDTMLGGGNDSDDDWGAIDFGGGSSADGQKAGRARVKNEPEKVEVAQGRSEKIANDVKAASLKIRRALASSRPSDKEVLERKLGDAVEKCTFMACEWENTFLMSPDEWLYQDLETLKTTGQADAKLVSKWLKIVTALEG